MRILGLGWTVAFILTDWRPDGEIECSPYRGFIDKSVTSYSVLDQKWTSRVIVRVTIRSFLHALYGTSPE